MTDASPLPLLMARLPVSRHALPPLTNSKVKHGCSQGRDWHVEAPAGG